MRTRRHAIVLALTTFLCLPPASAEAQLDRLKRTVEGETARQMDRLLREAIRCAIDDPSCPQEARRHDKDVIYTDANGEVIVDDDGVPITDREQAADRAGVDLSRESASGARQEAGDQESARPGEGVWANYDFVPGETVIYYEDYETDQVGDFPRRMEFMRGNWEVVEWQGRKLLRNTGPRNASLKIALPRELPERFTIETEAYFAHGNYRMVIATTPPAPGRHWETLKGNFFQIGVTQGTGVTTREGAGVESVSATKEVGEGLVAIRIMVDGSYAKVYAGERRVANVPNAEFPRSSDLYVENIYSGTPENPLYLGPIRIAEGGRDLYDRLAEDGHVATQGILFDIDSSRIRPESTPTLKEIGTMLQEHADLRIRIEGHTDSTGDDQHNQTLSEERAASVRQFLIDEYGLDASRLEAQGFGESRPVDSNDTPEGRQNNRRVELVRLDG